MCEVCELCFSEDPPGDFPPRGVFYIFLKIPPLPLSYPRGDRFPQKIYFPPQGELRGYYGISAQAPYVIFSLLPNVYRHDSFRRSQTNSYPPRFPLLYPQKPSSITKPSLNIGTPLDRVQPSPFPREIAGHNPGVRSSSVIRPLQVT